MPSSPMARCVRSAIRARYNAGDISYADLAREYGLNRRTIRLAVIGKRWAHVKGA
jgi:hypothetical protein